MNTIRHAIEINDHSCMWAGTRTLLYLSDQMLSAGATVSAAASSGGLSGAPH